MNDRLRQVRKAFELNQTDFANKMFIKQSQLSALERGSARITERHIAQLVALGVNEIWLRTGEGEMFASNEDARKEQINRILCVVDRLTPTNQQLAVEIVNNL